jgi:hypothetical protein
LAASVTVATSSAFFLDATTCIVVGVNTSRVSGNSYLPTYGGQAPQCCELPSTQRAVTADAELEEAEEAVRAAATASTVTEVARRL